MIDVRRLHSAPGEVRAALARRGDPTLPKLLDELEALDMRRRALAGQLDQLNAQRNEAARADGRVIKDKGALPPAVVEQRRQLGARISALEAELREVEAGVDEKALFVPNLPLPELPDGDAACNVVVRAWGEPAPAFGGHRFAPFTTNQPANALDEVGPEFRLTLLDILKPVTFEQVFDEALGEIVHRVRSGTGPAEPRANGFSVKDT